MSDCQAASKKLQATSQAAAAPEKKPQPSAQAAPQKPSAEKKADGGQPKVNPTSAEGGSAETIEIRQKQARKWINDWRARYTTLSHDIISAAFL